jgi:hypothetical protein
MVNVAGVHSCCPPQGDGDMTHPNEPDLETLREIRRDLYAAPSTDENVKRIKAIEKQIARKENRK